VMVPFPIWLILPLVPLMLTLLAWREGLRALASTESKDGIRSRTLLPMLLLAAPVAMLLGLVGRVANVASQTAPGRMIFIGAASSVVALITSTWSQRGFRPLAIFAAAAWVLCYGLPLLAMFSLAGLR